jgi:hypothetical protein
MTQMIYHIRKRGEQGAWGCDAGEGQRHHISLQVASDHYSV